MGGKGLQHMPIQGLSGMPGGDNVGLAGNELVSPWSCIFSGKLGKAEMGRERSRAGVGLAITFTTGSYPPCQAA